MAYFYAMKKWLPFLFLALLSLPACRIVEPRVSGVRGFAFSKDPEGRNAIRMEIRVDNPNRIGFKVTDPVFEVFLNSAKLGSAYSGKVIRVKARSDDYHEVFLGTDIHSLGQVLTPLLSILNTGKIQFEVKGDMTARVLFWKRTIHVGVSEYVNIGDLLKL